MPYDLWYLPQSYLYLIQGLGQSIKIHIKVSERQVATQLPHRELRLPVPPCHSARWKGLEPPSELPSGLRGDPWRYDSCLGGEGLRPLSISKGVTLVRETFHSLLPGGPLLSALSLGEWNEPISEPKDLTACPGTAGSRLARVSLCSPRSDGHSPARGWGRVQVCPRPARTTPPR